MQTTTTTNTSLSKICKKCKHDYQTTAEFSTHCKPCFKLMLKDCERCHDKFNSHGYRSICAPCYRVLNPRLAEIVPSNV